MGKTLQHKKKGKDCFPHVDITSRRKLRKMIVTRELMERIRREVKKLGQRIEERKGNRRPPKKPQRKKLFFGTVIKKNPELAKELCAAE